MSESKDIQCPVCGYYCLGNGGYGLSKKAEQTIEDYQAEKIKDRILAAVLWVFWSGAMLLTGFLYAMKVMG